MFDFAWFYRDKFLHLFGFFFFFFFCVRCFFCLFVCLFVFCVFVTHGSPLITLSFYACMLPLSCKGSYVLVASDICVTCNRFLKRQI